MRLPLAPPPGTLIAFRAEATHEATPVSPPSSRGFGESI